MSRAPITDFLYAKASRDLLPLSGTFELSPVCNFSCRMCYVRQSVHQVAASPRPIMTLEQWLAIAADARERGMLFLLLTGGEPLLHPDFWTLYERLVEMGFLISVNTNGSLIDGAAIARFTRLPPWRVNVTLYGASRETYARLCGQPEGYDRVCQAVDRLLQAGIRLKLNCSLTPHNRQDLPAMAEFARQRGLLLDTATYMFPPIRRDSASTGKADRFTPAQAAQYRLQSHLLRYPPHLHREYLHRVCAGQMAPTPPEESCIDPTDGKLRCRAGNAAFWITWDGWLTPCGLLPEPRQDLTKHTFSQCWDALTAQCRDLTVPGQCAQCPGREVCHPCVAMAYSETGSTKGVPAYLCQSTAYMKQLASQALAALEAEDPSATILP